MEFYGKYKPQTNKDADEYWITFEDFRCNFGGLIICSDPAPFRTEGMNIERCYRRLSDGEIKPNQKAIFKDRKAKAVEKKQARYSVPSYYTCNKRSSIPEIHEHVHRERPRYSVPRQFLEVKKESAIPGQEIQVKEDRKTVKIDNTYRKAYRKYTHHSKWNMDSNESNFTPGLRRLRNSHDVTHELLGKQINHASSYPSDVKTKAEDDYTQCRSGSITSNCSLLSQCPSTFSTSDITVHFQSSCGLTREDSLKRPRSAPGTDNACRKASSGSLPNITVSNFLATSSDHFQSHGSWRQIIDYRGIWESKCRVCFYCPHIYFPMRKPNKLRCV